MNYKETKRATKLFGSDKNHYSIKFTLSTWKIATAHQRLISKVQKQAEVLIWT
jgi:hypothetical protein